MRGLVLAIVASCASGGCEQILGIQDLAGPDGGKSHGDAGSGSGVPPVDGARCSAASSYVPVFGPDQMAVLEDPDPPQFSQRVDWTGQLSEQPPVELQLEVVGGGGSNTPDWPQQLGPTQEVDLAGSTDAVVLILSNLGSDGSPQDIYLAEQGTLVVQDCDATVGGKVEGTISNLQLVHVDAQGTGFVADPDGCKSSINSASFATTISSGM